LVRWWSGGSPRQIGRSRAGAFRWFLSRRSRRRSPSQGARHLEADAGAQHHLHEPGAAAGAVLREPPLEVLGEAEVVAGVLVGAGEVE
jgi:hypothetical protein